MAGRSAFTCWSRQWTRRFWSGTSQTPAAIFTKATPKISIRRWNMTPGRPAINPICARFWPRRGCPNRNGGWRCRKSWTWIGFSRSWPWRCWSRSTTAILSIGIITGFIMIPIPISSRWFRTASTPPFVRTTFRFGRLRNSSWPEPCLDCRMVRSFIASGSKPCSRTCLSSISSAIGLRRHQPGWRLRLQMNGSARTSSGTPQACCATSNCAMIA